eukprot:1469763-Alexandrium_andersonii.AAC.1
MMWCVSWRCPVNNASEQRNTCTRMATTIQQLTQPMHGDAYGNAANRMATHATANWSKLAYDIISHTLL